MKFRSFREFTQKVFLSKPVLSEILNIVGKKKKDTGHSLIHYGKRYPGTRNLDNSYLQDSVDGLQDYDSWKARISSIILKSENYVSLKFGDGDYYFLTKQEIGSAAPGKRAISIPYHQLDMSPYLWGLENADSVACESIRENLSHLSSIYSRKVPDFPAEYLYISIANRWLTQKFGDRLGIIGASNKIELIEELLQHEIYRDFIGIHEPIELIRIPQKFACDDLQKTVEVITNQIDPDKSKTYLMGVGHVKFGLVSSLKQFHNSQFLDIGSGVDALAGVIDIRRPYFAEWTNFRFSDISRYSQVDLLQASDFGKCLFVPSTKKY